MGNEWAKESERHGSGGEKFADIRDFKFKDNHTHNIRILPGKTDDDFPCYGYVIHWIPQMNSKKGRPIVHSFEKKCVVCDFVSELWTEINRLKEEEDMTDESPEVKKVYAKIQAIGGKKKYDMNVLDREDMFGEDKNKKPVIMPKRLSASSTIWKPVFEYAKNPKWGSPSNAKTGYDFEITIEGEQERRKYNLAPDRDASPLTDEELEAVKRGYDLPKLRKATSVADFQDILKNAKPPYNEIVNRIGDDDSEDKEDKNDKGSKEKNEAEEPEEKETPHPQEEKKTEKQKEPEVEKETAKEPEEVEEPETAESSASDDSDDPNNINSYECKGQCDKEDAGCKDCPVQTDCVELQPYVIKAKKLDINIDQDAEEIVKQVKEKEKPEEKVEEKAEEKKEGKIMGKKKRTLPF